MKNILKKLLIFILLANIGFLEFKVLKSIDKKYLVAGGIAAGTGLAWYLYNKYYGSSKDDSRAEVIDDHGGPPPGAPGVLGGAAVVAGPVRAAKETDEERVIRESIESAEREAAVRREAQAAEARVFRESREFAAQQEAGVARESDLDRATRESLQSQRQDEVRRRDLLDLGYAGGADAPGGGTTVAAGPERMGAFGIKAESLDGIVRELGQQIVAMRDNHRSMGFSGRVEDTDEFQQLQNKFEMNYKQLRVLNKKREAQGVGRMRRFQSRSEGVDKKAKLEKVQTLEAEIRVLTDRINRLNDEWKAIIQMRSCQEVQGLTDCVEDRQAEINVNRREVFPLVNQRTALQELLAKELDA